MGEILSRLLVFQIVFDLISVTVGAGLCFGALKWRRGLLTTTAIAWGFFLGLVAAIFIAEAAGEVGAVLCILIGTVSLPILTYTSPAVNRFVLGFLVSNKLFFMVATPLAKDGTIGIEEAILVPLVAGTVVGIGLMAWTRMRVSAFVLGCTFVGASQIAPIVSEWANRILFGITGDPTFLFDPIDLIFALFKIELTDWWTLGAMVVLMGLGAYKQIKNMKEKGIPLDTPLIGFEDPTGHNGRVYTKNGHIDTID